MPIFVYYDGNEGYCKREPAARSAESKFFLIYPILIA